MSFYCIFFLFTSTKKKNKLHGREIIIWGRYSIIYDNNTKPFQKITESIVTMQSFNMDMFKKRYQGTKTLSEQNIK